MTVSVVVCHTYQKPVEVVAATHLSKYPNEHDPNVLSCKTIEKTRTDSDVSYTKRIAVCNNVLPSILRRVPALNVDEVSVEEECSWNRESRFFSVKSKNLTWSSWVSMEESSSYKPHNSNMDWTYFSQEGSITVHGLGRFGSILEFFGQRFLTNGAYRSIKVTEMLIAEKSQKLFSFWYSQFIFA